MGVYEEYWVSVCVRQHGDVVSVWELGAGFQGSDGEVGVWGKFEAAERVEGVVLGCEESMESVVGELSDGVDRDRGRVNWSVCWSKRGNIILQNETTCWKV